MHVNWTILEDFLIQKSLKRPLEDDSLPVPFHSTKSRLHPLPIRKRKQMPEHWKQKQERAPSVSQYISPITLQTMQPVPVHSNRREILSSPERRRSPEPLPRNSDYGIGTGWGWKNIVFTNFTGKDLGQSTGVYSIV